MTGHFLGHFAISPASDFPRCLSSPFSPFYVKKMASTFSLDKRNFLHRQLDEVIRLWVRGSGQGSFSLTINDGTPKLQFGIRLGFEDAPGHPHHHLHHLQGGGLKRRGPARRERDRLRAARYQAAKKSAAVSAVSAPSFPGEGKVVGRAEKPTLPLPLPLAKGSVFPPVLPITTVCSTLSQSPVVMSSVVPMVTPNTTTTASLTKPLTATMTVPVHCRDALVSESEEDSDDEQFNSCGRCLEQFNSSSVYGYCPLCVKCYHTPQCATGHQCLSFALS